MKYFIKTFFNISKSIVHIKNNRSQSRRDVAVFSCGINKGQSLFEVMFAIGIAALVLIAIVSLSTQSVKTSDFSRNNALATKYAQEGAEWVRQQRDASADWNTFIDGRTGSDIAIGILDWVSGSNPIPNTVFSRIVRMENGSDLVNVTVTVSWADSGGTHRVTNSTILTNWRK